MERKSSKKKSPDTHGANKAAAKKNAVKREPRKRAAKPEPSGDSLRRERKPAQAPPPGPQPAPPSGPPSEQREWGTPEPAPSHWQDRYGEDRLVLMIRDPYWCFAYWELTPETQSDLQARLSGGQARLILRVYDVTDVEFDGTNAHRFMDVEISLEADNWYLNVWSADRSYCVELGLLRPDGKFEMILRSNLVTTPRDSVSSVIDEEWMVLDDTFERLYKAGGAEDRGRSSEAITKYMLKRVRADVSSGGLGSMGSEGGRPRVQAKEDFWLVVNTELIVYGATEPDAKVTIQGNAIRLNPDGTFSVRYALPDGRQEIPVRAENASGTQERRVTPIVEKRTE